MPDLPAHLTGNERAAIDLTAGLWTLLQGIVGNGPTRAADLVEATIHIHALQHMIMSQAAARAHPEAYRLLGECVQEVTA